MQVLHVGQVDQALQGKARKTVQVLRHHLQLKGAGTADVVAGDDLGQFFDGIFQHAGRVAGVAFGIQPNEGQHAQADFLAVKFGPVALDEAVDLQRTHAAPARRRR